MSAAGKKLMVEVVFYCNYLLPLSFVGNVDKYEDSTEGSHEIKDREIFIQPLKYPEISGI